MAKAYLKLLLELHSNNFALYLESGESHGCEILNDWRQGITAQAGRRWDWWDRVGVKTRSHTYRQQRRLSRRIAAPLMSFLRL